MKLRSHDIHTLDLRPVTMIELRKRSTSRCLDLLALCGGAILLGLYLLFA